MKADPLMEAELAKIVDEVLFSYQVAFKIGRG